MDLQQALSILGRVGAGETLSLSELTQARDVIARQLHSLRGAASPDLDALTTLRESYFAADAAVKAVAEQEQAAANDVDAALSDIPNPDEEAAEKDPEDDEDEDPEKDPKEDEEDDEKSLSSKPKKGKMLSVQEAVARLGLSGTPGLQVNERPADLSITKTSVILNGDRVADPTMFMLAEAFRDSSGRSLKTGKERVARFETSFAEDRTLTGKINADTRLLDSFVSPEAVVASGGCCSLPQPIYTNPVQGSTARPIRDALPTLGATRGKFTFFNAICLPVDGFGVWTCEDDELVDEADPDTWKVCAEVDCDDTDEVGVDAVYSCVVVGNYQTRFAPEQWQGYLAALAIQNARRGEVLLFEKMRDAVLSTYTVPALGSVFANVVNGVGTAAAALRSDQRLGDIQLDYFVGESLLTAVRLDLINRRVFSSAVDDPNIAASLLSTAFSNEGINVHYSQDLDPVSFGSGGDDPEFPLTLGSVLAPNGFFTFLDGGTLDLGTEIRDHNLNRQNKVAAFAESYEGILARGCNALGLDIPVEICDNVACPS
ncbi:MAG TPA: major capsid protein [Marmoricola sp.]